LQSELAAKKIAAVLETNREHEALMEEYDALSTDLLAWIAATIERLDDRPALNTVTECQVDRRDSRRDFTLG
jgi:actinin alpha